VYDIWAHALLIGIENDMEYEWVQKN